MQDKHSKTEQPTPKKLRDSRKKGQTAKSADLNAAVSFLSFALFLGVLGQHLFVQGIKMLEYMLSSTVGHTLSAADAGNLLLSLTGRFAFWFLPFGFLAVVVGIGTNLVQVGFLFSLEAIKPDFKRLNPIEGFKNIFSSKALFNLVKSLLKLVVVAFLTYVGLRRVQGPVMNAGQIGVEKLFPFFIDTVRTLSLGIAALMIVLGVMDLVFQKKEFKKKQMMTKQEIKEEYKQMEGDPKIKSKRQARQRELSMARTMEAVATASVVITNPTHYAIALRYEPGKDPAPVVLAKGMDHMAKKIREQAEAHGIPLIENKPLARTLYPQVEAGGYVPVELYQAMAEILALVYQIKSKKGKV